MTRLRKRMVEELQRRNYAQVTIDHYIQIVEDFAKHFGRHPDQLGARQLREYQVHLFRDRKLSSRTVRQHVAALRFFFVKMLKRCFRFSGAQEFKRGGLSYRDERVDGLEAHLG